MHYFNREDSMELILDIGKLEAQMGNVDLNTLIAFKTAELEKSSVSVKYINTTENTNLQDTSSFSFANIQIDKAQIIDSEFEYFELADDFSVNIKSKQLTADDLLIDITNEDIRIEETFAENTSCIIEYSSDTDTLELDDDLNWGQYLWRVSGDKLETKGFSVSLNYLKEPNDVGHFNSSHLNLYDINSNLTDFTLNEDSVIINIQQFSGKEKNGFEISKLQAEVKMDSSLFYINNMELLTPYSIYKASLKSNLNPTNYNDIDTKSINLQLNIRSQNLKEIDYFYSLQQNNEYLKEHFYKGNYQLNANINGDMNLLNIQNVFFQYRDSIQFVASGELANLQNTDSLNLQLAIEKLLLSSNELAQNFQLTLPNSGFSFPNYALINGEYIGGNTKQSFNGEIATDIGKISIAEAEVNFSKTPEYKIKLNAELDKLHTINTLGIDEAYFNFAANYKGQNLFDATANIDYSINSLLYHNYQYKDISVRGVLNKGQFTAQLESQDTNIMVKIKADGMLSEQLQKLHLVADFQQVKLKELNLLENEYSFQTKSDFTFSIQNDNEIKLNAFIDNLQVSHSDTVYQILPNELSFETNNINTHFLLDGHYHHLHFSADKSMDSLFSLIETISHQQLFDTTAKTVDMSLPNFHIDAHLNYPKAFAQLVLPKDLSFEKIEINGDYSKAENVLEFKILVPKLKYQDYETDSLLLSLTGTSNELYYRLHSGIQLDELITGKIDLSGKYKNSELSSTLSYKDAHFNQFLNIETITSFHDQNISIHFIPDNLVFDYSPWEIKQDNHILFNTSSLVCNNMQLLSETQQISLNSFATTNAQNLELLLANIDIKSIEPLFSLDTIVTGIANAKIQFFDLYHQTYIEGELSINQFHVNGFNAGKLNMSKIIFKDDIFEADMGIFDANNDIILNAKYDINQKENPINISLDIKSFDLKNLNYLLDDKANNAKGKVSGKLLLQASTNKAVLNGNINFNDAGIGITSLNNYFTIGTESISIKDNVLSFNEFSITNKQNQTAKIIGNISFNTWNSPISNLHIETDNMEILNSTKEDSEMVFGLLKAQTSIDIIGKADQLKIKSLIDIDGETNITYIFPDRLSINDNKGIVHFNKYYIDTLRQQKKLEKMSFFSLENLSDIKSTIKIEQGADFKLYFDKGGKDFLDAKLYGNMNYNVVENTTKISGIFNIEEGKLRYSIPMVNVNDFNIEPGSFISMSDEIYNPHININASANIRASTEGLLPNYDKVMTFKVLLHMYGDLNDVKIKFDISSETSDAIVSSRISQLTEQERNANALNLLVRGAFIISVSGTDAGSSSMVDAQIDKFYASQLNHLISENINFVDFDFDVQSFYDYGASGQQVFKRNYYYDVGKEFFHNRVSIKYKGSLELAANTKNDDVNSNFVQNELTVEYKLTKDGAYKLLLFRKDKYEGILEGNVIETGGGFRLTKSFYSFRDIFSREMKANKLDKNAKAEGKNE